jgi:hypothetical protein
VPMRQEGATATPCGLWKPPPAELCVPKTSSTSCDMEVFVDDAAEAVAPMDFELL